MDNKTLSGKDIEFAFKLFGVFVDKYVERKAHAMSEPCAYTGADLDRTRAFCKGINSTLTRLGLEAEFDEWCKKHISASLFQEITGLIPDDKDEWILE